MRLPCPRHIRPMLGAALTALIALTTLTPTPARADLAYADALRLALDQAPMVQAQQAALASVQAAQPAAAALPDPRLSLGIENLPISGADRDNFSRDFMTMQRIALSQELPNRAKRAARADGAAAKVERERANLVAVQLAQQREAALAWLAVYFAEQRGTHLARLEHENRLLTDTLPPRIAAGRVMPAELALARQEALALADRRDDAARDIARARSALRRWVGERSDEPLAGQPDVPAPQPGHLHAHLAQNAEIAPLVAQQALARAEAAEADADQRGDWGWTLAYSKRSPAYSDMLSFQVSIDLPWQRGQRQQPLLAAKRYDIARLDAERDALLRQHQAELDTWLADLAALDAQWARAQGPGTALADQRVTLALASYEAGRGDLGAVLAARRERAEAAQRLLDLDAQRLALRVRLNTLIAE